MPRGLEQVSGRRDDGTVPNVGTRPAVGADADQMGLVMVESFLAAHRGQMPEAAYRKRVAEWTPEVSAQAWGRALAELADGRAQRDVLLVAEDDGGRLLGIVSGGAAEEELSTGAAEIGALYVSPVRQREGIGRSLLRAAAAGLAEHGFTELRISVLTANLPARAFYEAMGGRAVGEGTVDEEGYLLPITVYGWPDVRALDLDRE